MKTSRLFPRFKGVWDSHSQWLLLSLCSAAIGGEVKPASPSPEAQVHLEGRSTAKRPNGSYSSHLTRPPSKKAPLGITVLPNSRGSSSSTYLINQAYVTVVGEKTSCKSKLLCVEVDSIAPALYHPLDGRSGK